MSGADRTELKKAKEGSDQLAKAAGENAILAQQFAELAMQIEQDNVSQGMGGAEQSQEAWLAKLRKEGGGR